ncbi:hypothetical protein [Pseudomonas sp. SLFW]|uniref:hypothetical protein n=1 Tax=Pseudomonas sp. SLFW TaxID=2683259 RepID=UPI002113D585|nr:hypothetical protein [Pseudomonas sp. SLFW]
MKPLHIFKPGRHQPMSGGSLNFTERDLIATANAYNPALHEAPLVIGHPQYDAPAAGWVKSLTGTAEGLIAEPQQIDPSFAEQIGKASFKKISASFYHPDAANNPGARRLLPASRGLSGRDAAFGQGPASRRTG